MSTALTGHLQVQYLADQLSIVKRDINTLQRRLESLHIRAADPNQKRRNQKKIDKALALTATQLQRRSHEEESVLANLRRAEQLSQYGNWGSHNIHAYPLVQVPTAYGDGYNYCQSPFPMTWNAASYDPGMHSTYPMTWHPYSAASGYGTSLSASRSDHDDQGSDSSLRFGYDSTGGSRREPHSTIALDPNDSLYVGERPNNGHPHGMTASDTTPQLRAPHELHILRRPSEAVRRDSSYVGGHRKKLSTASCPSVIARAKNNALDTEKACKLERRSTLPVYL